MNIKFKILLCILCVDAKQLTTDTQRILSNIQDFSDDTLFQTLLTFTKIKVKFYNGYVRRTLFVGTFCENPENRVYQSDLINALLKIYQQSHHQYILSDQFHVKKESFENRLSYMFVDGIDAML